MPWNGLKSWVSCLAWPSLSSWAEGHSSQPPTAHATPARPLPWRWELGWVEDVAQMACWSCFSAWSSNFCICHDMFCLGVVEPHLIFWLKKLLRGCGWLLYFRCHGKVRTLGPASIVTCSGQWSALQSSKQRVTSTYYISPLKKHARKDTQEGNPDGWWSSWPKNPLGLRRSWHIVTLPSARWVASPGISSWPRRHLPSIGMDSRWCQGKWAENHRKPHGVLNAKKKNPHM